MCCLPRTKPQLLEGGGCIQGADQASREVCHYLGVRVRVRIRIRVRVRVKVGVKVRIKGRVRVRVIMYRPWKLEGPRPC